MRTNFIRLSRQPLYFIALAFLMTVSVLSTGCQNKEASITKPVAPDPKAVQQVDTTNMPPQVKDMIKARMSGKGPANTAPAK